MKPILEIRNLWKSYKVGAKQERYLSLRDSMAHFFKHGWQEKEEFWALQDISFDVYPGDTLGIIGRNGAGKTTLLKILSRITPPTCGSITVRGRMASLLEVGTGFHPELTGRENIYLNGSILGLKRAEINRQFDAIVDFSGVEQFLDTPLKHFSSGMQLRLAFAVAAHLEPEILLIDEVLAVGDAEFQKKCLGKMDEVSKSGRTILFVSHNLNALRTICNKGILVNKGQIKAYDTISRTIEKYLQFESAHNSQAVYKNPINISEVAISIREVKLMNSEKKLQTKFDLFEDIQLMITYEVKKKISGSIINIEIIKAGETIGFSFDTDVNPKLLTERKIGKYETSVIIPGSTLKPGRYSISVGSGIANLTKLDHLEECLTFEVELANQNESVLSYASKRKGIVAMILKWESRSIEN